MDYGERIDVESILVSGTWVVDSAINQTLAFHILREKIRMNRLRETDILHVRHRYVWPATEQDLQDEREGLERRGDDCSFIPFGSQLNLGKSPADYPSLG